MNRSGATMILHSGSAYHSKAKSMRMICTADARWSHPRVRLCLSKPEIYTTTEQHIHGSHHTVAHSSFCTYSFITAALEYAQLTDPPPPSGFPKAFTRPFHIPPTIFNFAAPDLHLLEGEMKRLFLLGYRWSHTYTQCVLQSALQSIKNKSEFDISECNAQLDQDLEGALNAIEGDEMEHIDPQNLAIVRFTPSVADPHSDFADEFYYPPMEEILPAARNNGAGETEKGGDAEEHKSENDKSNVITAQLENESGKDHSSDSNKAYGNPSVLSSMGDDRKAALHDMARNMNHELAFVPPEPLPYDDEEEEPVMNRQDIINDRLSLPPPALPMSLYFDENDNGLSPYDVSRKHYDYDLLFQSPYSTPPRVSPMYKRSERPLGTFENGRTDLEGFFRKLLRRSALQSENLRKLARMLTDLGSTESSKGASPLDYSASPNYFPPSGIEEFRNYNDRGFNNFQEPPQNSQYQGEGRPEDQISYYSPYGVGYPPGPYSRNEPEIPILEPPADEAEEALLDALDPPYIKSDYDKPEEPSDTSVARFDKNANPIYDPYEQPIDVQDSYQWVVPNNVPSENSYASPQRGVPPTLSEEITYGRPYLAYNYPAYDYRDYPDYYDYGGDYGNPSGPTPWNFHRDERYDVKKPGPFFKSKNDFAFDYPDGDAPPNDYDPGENNWIAKMDPLEGEAVLLTKLRQSQGLNKDGTKMYHGKELKELQMDQFPDLLLTDEGYVQDSGSKVRGIGPHGFPKASHQVALQNSDGKEGEAQPKEPDSYVYISISEDFPSVKQAEQMVNLILDQSGPPKIHMSQIQNLSVEKNQVRFQVKDGTHGETAAHLAEKTEELRDAIMEKTGMEITQAGVGTKRAISAVVYSSGNHQMLAVAAIVCGVCAALLVAATTLFFLRRHSRSKSKLQGITAHDTEASKDYQDLCRARMAGKGDGKDPLASGPGHAQPVGSAQSGHVPGQRISSLSKESDNGNNSPSSRSSTSSWNEEPVISNMDISTGHMVLSYMEDHLRNKDRLDQEWVALCAYEAEPCACHVALKPENLQKNRYQDAVPYDHNRVILNEHTNVSGSNYINASSITDHDPRNPAYIVTQGPLAATAADFWQLVWEQGSVVIVMLTRLTENGQALCHRYWPEEGSELYHIYEVHLVSEHIWCDDYLVRSFYLKNVRTGETRTVSQFHFLSWPESGIPASTKALLGFRRKVNKSYRGSSCPIIVNCSDGVGRSGTYCLIDMVLNRMSKGAKEIDIAATLEHIRDQRPNMVKTKAQFEFVLMSVAEEVHAILKALPQ